MTNPDTLLTVVAIRLAALVAAAVVIRASPEPPRQDLACVSAQTVAVPLQKAKAAELDAEEAGDAIVHDMRLHD